MNKKRIMLSILIGVICIGIVGVTYAAFTYSRVGTSNSKQIVGDIYMHYRESNVLTLENAMPSSTYDSTKYFEFTIDGKNTYTKKDIIYDITLNHGDNLETRTTRIQDKFLKFTLMEKLDGEQEFTTVVDSKSYSDLSDGIRIWVNQINKNTTSEIVNTYRLYMWISDEVKIGTGDVDYDMTTWNNQVYASIKVGVTGDFEEKEAYKTSADKVLAQINNKTTCNPSTAVVERPTSELNQNMTEEELQACVSFATTTMHVSSNSEAEAFCKGTGEVYGSTFQGWLDGYNGGFPQQFITYFQEHNITTTTKEFVGYDEDGAIYLSGTNDCVDFNYVWYSGKLWRIVAIYNDGTMKLVTDNAITAISYNEDGNTTFLNSYLYQWLNEDFLDTLDGYQNVIDTSKKWNVATTGYITTIGTQEVSGAVGSLNSYEYYKSYQNTNDSNGYLNIGHGWWLLNPSHTSNVWIVGTYGSMTSVNPKLSYAVRPCIYLKSSISFDSGTGTENDPYIIKGQKNIGKINDNINTRISGEYVRLDSDLYRIVGIENNTTKLVAINNADNVAIKQYGATNNDVTYGNGTNNITWDYFLNNDWYNNLSYKGKLTSGTYYLGTLVSGQSYKLSICSSVTGASTKDCQKVTPKTFNVGLLRYGEMFATTSQGAYGDWLITPYDASNVWYVDFGGSAYNDSPNYSRPARPCIYLKFSIKIVSGTGTPNDPYVVN